MTSRFPGCALFVLLCAAPATLSTSAQTPAAIIQCASCGLSGQAAATGNFDASQFTFVTTVRPAFFEDRTVQGEIIGRVVQVSPLMVEMLDMRTRLVDRNLRTVADGDVDDDTVCDIRRIERVDLASKAIASSLRFNDIIFGLMMMNQNAERPDNFIASTTVLTAVRRVSGPVRYFHTPALKGCANRSGRVLEYRSDTNDAVTVFNDGRIVYRDAQFRRFEQERLTAGELSDLMRAFASANFDALPADVGRPEHGPRPGITLVAARYQEVWLAGKAERLAPLVARMNNLATHATSNTYFLLKRGRPQPLTILPWPYRQIRLGGFSGYKDRARMQRGAYVDNPVPNARAMEERFPAAFVSRLPVYTPMADTSNEPNRYVYFSEDGALYRVRIISGCTPPDAFYCGTFYALEVDPVPDIDIELLTPAERTYRLLRANGRVGDSETERLDLFANVARLGLRAENRLGTYVWTGAMGLRLADLPPNGATIEREEYERHKAIYVAIQRYQENGMDLIEGDVIFEHVRVCQIEPGVADTCEVK